MEAPNYFAIIPASVRYDNQLKPNEKLLYGEITSLTQKDGYCFASNAYFANLYNVDKITISRWISRLEKHGYIKNEIVKNRENQVVERKIFITNNNIPTAPPIDEIINTPLTKKSIGYRQNNQYPIDEKVKDNNTSINNTSINNTSINNIPPISPKGEKAVKKIFETYANGNNELLLALNDFEKMRKSIKSPLSTDRAYKGITDKLDELAKGDDSIKIKLLDIAITNCWKSVYMPKEGLDKAVTKTRSYDLNELDNYWDTVPTLD